MPRPRLVQSIHWQKTDLRLSGTPDGHWTSSPGKNGKTGGQRVEMKLAPLLPTEQVESRQELPDKSGPSRPMLRQHR